MCNLSFYFNLLENKMLYSQDALFITKDYKAMNI